MEEESGQVLVALKKSCTGKGERSNPLKLRGRKSEIKGWDEGKGREVGKHQEVVTFCKIKRSYRVLLH